MKRNLLTPLLVLLMATLAGLSEISARGAGQVEFLAPEAAARVLTSERSEPYFERMQRLELKAHSRDDLIARTLRGQREELQRRFAAGTRSFTEEEQNLLRKWTARIDATVGEAYPKFGQQGWSFIKTSDAIEGGLPHTVNASIVFSERILSWMVRLDDLHTSESLMQEIGYLLVHEQMHVLQRLHPEWFAPLYEELWGLEHAGKISQPQALRDRQMLNPDGLDLGWVQPLEGADADAVWPLLVLEPVEHPVMGEHMEMVGVYLRETSGGLEVIRTEQGDVKLDPLMEVEAYADRYLGSTNIYHPNESSADLFGRLAVEEEMLGGEQEGAQWAELRGWFSRIFASATARSLENGEIPEKTEALQHR